MLQLILPYPCRHPPHLSVLITISLLKLCSVLRAVDRDEHYWLAVSADIHFLILVIGTDTGASLMSFLSRCSHLHLAGHASSYSVGGSMTPTGSPPLGIGPLQHQPYILRGLRDQPTLTKAYGQAGSQVRTCSFFFTYKL